MHILQVIIFRDDTTLMDLLTELEFLISSASSTIPNLKRMKRKKKERKSREKAAKMFMPDTKNPLNY